MYWLGGSLESHKQETVVWISRPRRAQGAEEDVSRAWASRFCLTRQSPPDEFEAVLPGLEAVIVRLVWTSYNLGRTNINLF